MENKDIEKREKAVIQRHGTKRRRVENQLREGISFPAKRIDDVEPVEGCLGFICPSKSFNYFTPDKKYEIYIKIIGGEMKFFCTCDNKLGDKPSESCSHINDVMLKMIQEYIKKSSLFAAKKEEQQLGVQNVVNDISDILDDFRNMDI